MKERAKPRESPWVPHIPSSLSSSSPLLTLKTKVGVGEYSPLNHITTLFNPLMALSLQDEVQPLRPPTCSQLPPLLGASVSRTHRGLPHPLHTLPSSPETPLPQAASPAAPLILQRFSHPCPATSSEQSPFPTREEIPPLLASTALWPGLAAVDHTGPFVEGGQVPRPQSWCGRCLEPLGRVLQPS